MQHVVASLLGRGVGFDCLSHSVLLVVLPFAGLVPDDRAGFLARKGDARGSPESLPPGEGKRGTQARLSVGAKGRGITPPARSA